MVHGVTQKRALRDGKKNRYSILEGVEPKTAEERRLHLPREIRYFETEEDWDCMQKDSIYQWNTLRSSTTLSTHRKRTASSISSQPSSFFATTLASNNMGGSRSAFPKGKRCREGPGELSGVFTAELEGVSVVGGC